MKIIEFESLSSTNDYAKAHLTEGNMIITAKRQTAGRGSKHRSFDSGAGGLYLTKLTFYENFPACDVFRIMLNASVAVCRTVEDFGLSAAIKWPNDVYVGGKKICGILIENSFSGAFIRYSVVGIGVNVNNSLPEKLKEIATTMATEKKKEFSVDAVKEKLIMHLTETFSVEEYKRYIFFFGQKVRLLQEDGIHEAIACDVDEKGRLIVEEFGVCHAVTAGEVSLRFESI